MLKLCFLKTHFDRLYNLLQLHAAKTSLIFKFWCSDANTMPDIWERNGSRLRKHSVICIGIIMVWPDDSLWLSFLTVYFWNCVVRILVKRTCFGYRDLRTSLTIFCFPRYHSITHIISQIKASVKWHRLHEWVEFNNDNRRTGTHEHLLLF